MGQEGGDNPKTGETDVGIGTWKLIWKLAVGIGMGVGIEGQNWPWTNKRGINWETGTNIYTLLYIK